MARPPKETTQLRKRNRKRKNRRRHRGGVNNGKHILFSTILWNLEGLISLMKLCPDDILRTHNILLLTETLLTKPIDIEGFYSFHSLSRPPANRGRPSGGIRIACKPYLEPELIQCNESSVTIRTPYATLACCYPPPEAPPDEVAAIIESTLQDAPNDRPIILMGDFNTRLDCAESEKLRFE